MQKFHSIATDRYIPLSFDNAYLFSQYDRISNFLVFNLDKTYRNFLAKPVKSNYEIDWYSVHTDLQPIEQSDHREFGLKQYWLVFEELQKQVEELLRSNDSNVQYWGAILKTVLNPEDNLIFTNGKDISIVWGWKFENNQNSKPNLLIDNIPDALLPPQILIEEPKLDIEKQPTTAKTQTEKMVSDENNTDTAPRDAYFSPTIEQQGIVAATKKARLLTFLKYIAVTYWWVLILLLVLICLVFFFKSLTIKS
ncbi:hypothetical protein [Sphingobacterium paludis]|uniref:Uncharacterized protein n=1 Tax=Sphingobacterium paludis TaxID=1476465 RepID=A0A4V3E1D6_9SPHI|nr:hypothetical protein [Sphingobacterium paludis]TDS12358.1 hypothetical protein B0I21_106216 [Sphingobacterium paludis]